MKPVEIPTGLPQGAVCGVCSKVVPCQQSGMGRECGRAVIEAYTELKSECIAH